MGQISNLPPFVSIQVASGQPAIYGDTVETGTGGEFYYQVGGDEVRQVHGPIPKLGPIPMHDVFVHNPAESLSSVSGSWNGVSRTVQVLDIDKNMGLQTRLTRDPVTSELILAIDNASDKASHRILIPLRVNGSSMEDSQLGDPAILTGPGTSPVSFVTVTLNGGMPPVKGGAATVTLSEPSGNARFYTLSNQDSTVRASGSEANGVVTAGG